MSDFHMIKIHDKRRILIAVDNGIINLDLKKQIDKLGYKTETDRNLNLKDKNKIDIIILSENLLEEYKKNKMIIEKYKIPVIFLTSGKKKNPLDLTMPFDEEQLISVIEHSRSIIN